ncbi:uncharacterized protein BDR25DRAFT_395654 [Lindgomyces ingoldianus]|uniref:Uncharacterized protein n=1 Tax=Lindgomyces ingoldianus TaxID=673940 RepID=A0ACB6QKX1_9PLEO|nr:uncharacterized protein BDR25DRAFT_395654 [Lindgomyces ingoldianus]KAF2466791.1 hypothetical protein BDR25DRAFT_395654 [Lindgomyces ingoldianus]
MRSFAFQVLATFTLSRFTPIAVAQPEYSLVDDLSYKNFFTSFEFYNDPDPSHGFVQYQSIEDAVKNEYIGYLNESIYLGVNYKDQTPEGRPSIRVESTKHYNQGLLIMDIVHMPDSICGTWPAAWMLSVSETWPNGGEIDIIEGVNHYTQNTVTLHTSTGCTVSNTTGGGQGNMNEQATFTGFMATSNCDVAATDQPKNVGCSIHDSSLSAPSYGTEFNQAGGGIYAMEWTTTDISVWLFARNSTSLPKDLTMNPEPGTFGTPIAKFQGSGCDFKERFKDLKIILGITFCGEWAGEEKEWAKSCAAKTGASTCEEYVRDNPEAFAQAYWEIKGLLEEGLWVGSEISS